MKETGAKQESTDWNDADSSGLATETKMGMAIVVVLVLAFGMLVYHKFDLRQQQLANIDGAGKGDFEQSDAGTVRGSAGLSGSENVEALAALDRQPQMPPGVQRSALADLESTAFTMAGQSSELSAEEKRDEPAGAAADEAILFDLSEPVADSASIASDDVPFDFDTTAAPADESVAKPSPADFPSFTEEGSNESTVTVTEVSTAVTDEEDPFAVLESAAAKRSEPELLFPEEEVASQPVSGEFAAADEADAPDFASFVSATNDSVESSEVQPPVSIVDAKPAFEETGTAAVSSQGDAPLLPSASDAPVLFEPAGQAASPEFAVGKKTESPLEPPAEFPVADFGADAAGNVDTSVPLDLSQELPFEDPEPAEDVLIALAEPSAQENPFADLTPPEEVAAPTASKGTPGQSSGFSHTEVPKTLGNQFEPDNVQRNATSERSVFDAGHASPSIRNAAYDADPARIQQVSVVADECEISEVRPDDNYWKISKRMYGTARYFSALALYNRHRISDPKKLRPGMKVLIPDPRVLEKRYPELFVDSVRKQKLPAGFFVQQGGSPAYRVGDRETLSEISQKHLGRASRWIQIYRLNQKNLQDPNKLKPGTVLRLPEDATDVHIVP